MKISNLFEWDVLKSGFPIKGVFKVQGSEIFFRKGLFIRYKCKFSEKQATKKSMKQAPESKNSLVIF